MSAFDSRVKTSDINEVTSTLFTEILFHIADLHSHFDHTWVSNTEPQLQMEEVGSERPYLQNC